MKRQYLIPLIIIVFCLTAFPQNLRLGGYCENLTAYTHADTGFFSDIGLLRLEATAGNDQYALEAHVILKAALQPLDPTLAIKPDSKLGMLYSELVQGLLMQLPQDSLIDMDFLQADMAALRYLPYTTFWPKETFTLDRALIKLYFKHVDLYMGRQMIAWGTGYAFNPTDIWNQKNPLDPSTPKVGTNALRLEIPMGSLSNLNLLALPGPDIKHSSVGIRMKTNFAGFDYSLSASRFMNADREVLGLPEKLVGGVDIVGQLFDVGVWFEGAFISQRFKGMRYTEFDSTYIQTDVGMDYTFDNGVYVLLEYFFNGRGEPNPDDYQAGDIFLQFLGDMPGLGQNYLITGLKQNFLEKIDATLFVLSNIDEPSAIIMPGADYYFCDEVSLGLKGTIAAGERKRSEFGSLYHGVQLKATAYF
jgi:hypothetical protein